MNIKFLTLKIFENLFKVMTDEQPRGGNKRFSYRNTIPSPQSPRNQSVGPATFLL